MAKQKSAFKRLRRRIRYSAIYIVLRIMIFVSNLMPRITWLKMCGALGRLAFWLAPNSRRLVRKHLTLVYKNEKSTDEIKSLSRDVFEMLGKNAGDVIRGFMIGKISQFEKFRVINGAEHLENAYKKGKGVIFLTAHLGSFEYVATELSFRGYKPLIVGTRMKDEKLNNLLSEQRSKLGASAVERGKDTVKLVRNLKGGGTMAILIDQDTKVKSRIVNFLGHPCATPIGATLLALKTGAAVVPIFTHLRDDYKLEVNCYPELELVVTGEEETDLVTNTQILSDVIEREVRKYPAQWVWMHQRWRTKPGEEIR